MDMRLIVEVDAVNLRLLVTVFLLLYFSRLTRDGNGNLTKISSATRTDATNERGVVTHVMSSMHPAIKC